MAVTLIVRIKAKPGHGEVIRQLLSPLPPENDIQGCLGWDIFSNAGDADDIIIFERWASVAAHRSFIEPLIASGGLNEVQSHSTSIERTYYNVIEA
jgi:quinol monooxygenase YgiN